MATSKQLTSELTAFDKAAQNPVDVYNQALNKLGIADARTQVTSLRKSILDNQNLLNNLSGNIKTRTANSLVTESQRQKLYATEAAPITQQGSQLSGELGVAQATEQSIMGQGKQEADLLIQGQQSKRQALMDRLNIAIKKEQDAETKRRWQAEYNRQQAQFEANRQLELQKLAAAKASSGGGGGSSSSGGSGYYYTPSASGGYSFFNASGKPVTAYKYAASTGQSIRSLLAVSNDKTDKKIVKLIDSGASLAELRKKYPYVFNG